MEKIEFKRTCNKCGNVWYAPKEYIDKLKSGRTDGTLAVLFFDIAQGARNKQVADMELMKISMCSKCNSMDYNEEIEKVPEPVVSNAVPVTQVNNKTVILAIIFTIIFFAVIFTLFYLSGK